MVTDEGALLELLRHLDKRQYRFTCVTPATHERVLDRPISGEPTLRDIFGWNLAFSAGEVEFEILELLKRAGCVEETPTGLRSLVRVASMDDHLFVHSSFPTSSPDAVFFGPDTYRFVRFIRSRLSEAQPPRWIVDMGAGTGAGGIVLATHVPSVRLTLVDVNPAAAAFARANARFAGVEAEIIVSDKIPAGCDLVIANPPYMMDASHRTYRDGGRLLGGEMACQWVGQALDALAPGGRMLLYTGTAIVRGRSPLVESIESSGAAAGAELEIKEIDPDVFGEELDRPDYCDVERIAAIGIAIRRRTGGAHATS